MTVDESLLHQLADAADALTLPAWQGGDFEVLTKPNGTPVTAVDVSVEEALRAILAEHEPDDGFLGEEVGATSGTTARTWIVDGIDGTSAFTTQRSEWSTMVGLVDNGRPIAGIVTAPTFDRRWLAPSPDRAYMMAGEGPAAKLAVSDRSTLSGASVGRWPWRHDVKPALRDRAQLIADLIPAEQPVRPGPATSVPIGAMLVADGRLDAFVMFGGQPWDHAGPAAIVAAAGGRFSCLDGTLSLATGAGVYTNGLVHDELLDRLSN